jgi:hypothetical protein
VAALVLGIASLRFVFSMNTVKSILPCDAPLCLIVSHAGGSDQIILVFERVVFFTAFIFGSLMVPESSIAEIVEQL